MRRSVIAGILAGAVGTLALNVATYLDMLLRGRPASRLPDEAAEGLADLLGVDLGEDDVARNRREALGALSGMGIGVAIGAAWGVAQARLRLPAPVAALALGGGAMIITDVPMTALKMTDPRDWCAAEWAADLLPHLAYGTAAATTYAMIEKSRQRGG